MQHLKKMAKAGLAGAKAGKELLKVFKIYRQFENKLNFMPPPNKKQMQDNWDKYHG